MYLQCKSLYKVSVKVLFVSFSFKLMACKVALSADNCSCDVQIPLCPFNFFICLKSRIKTINKIAVNRLTLAEKVGFASGSFYSDVDLLH
jgi:hypothetical protein